MTVKFDEESSLGKALKQWWQELENHKGDRAQLRRAKSPVEVMLLPVYHRAYSRFKCYFEHETNWEPQLATVLGLVSHVSTPSSETIAKQMAGNPPVVSELRFRRLIQRDRNDLYPAMIRAIRMLGKQVNIYDLAASTYYWGDQVKRRWAFDYFPNTPEKQSA